MTQVKNLMEEIVYETIDDILKEIRVCSCKQCQADIAAKALNDLAPRYFVTEKGKIFTKIETLKLQTEVDVITAVTKAAIIVKRHPRHET